MALPTNKTEDIHMKTLINKINQPEAIARREQLAREMAHRNTNMFQMKSHCSSDKAGACLMAVHNFGAGGVDVFCSSIGTLMSDKRRMQRNARCLRAMGVRS